MMHRMRRLALAVALLAQAALAAELTPQQLALIKREEQKALDQVNAAHGDKKPSELSSEERRQIIEEQQKASREVLERYGVSPKDYAKASANMAGGQRAQVEAEERALAAKEEQERRAAAAKKAEPSEPVIEYGTPGSGAQKGKAASSTPKAKSGKSKRRY
jgi:hypothetical protein